MKPNPPQMLQTTLSSTPWNNLPDPEEENLDEANDFRITQNRLQIGYRLVTDCPSNSEPEVNIWMILIE